MVYEARDEPILVTGAAGFIGFHVVDRLLREGFTVVGLDNLDAYYDPALKAARLARLETSPAFRCVRADLAEPTALENEDVRRASANVVVHLAAQAGVRYSLVNPAAYARANLTGFTNILELCRASACRHLLYASSSAVYGANASLPFRASDATDHPTSFYAATKKANEAMAHSYAHLYGLPTTGMRFFTVFGPWGRPDMAMSLFAAAMRAGEPIRLFDAGRHRRDYTYVDDVAETIIRLIGLAPAASGTEDPSLHTENGPAPWRIVNIGSGRPVAMDAVVSLLEHALGCRAAISIEPAQPGDLPATFADIEPLVALTGYRPATRLEDGVAAFARWHADYYGQPAGD